MQEKDRALRLILPGRGHLPVDREMREERFDVGSPERLRVPLAVEEDEAFNPVQYACSVRRL